MKFLVSLLLYDNKYNWVTNIDLLIEPDTKCKKIMPNESNESCLPAGPAQDCLLSPYTLHCDDVTDFKTAFLGLRRISQK